MLILTIFENCGDNEASVATFVANLFFVLDNADLDETFLKQSLLKFYLPIKGCTIKPLRPQICSRWQVVVVKR